MLFCLLCEVLIFLDVPRHEGRVITLQYTPEGKIQSTYMFVGKVRLTHVDLIVFLLDYLFITYLLFGLSVLEGIKV